ncbi:Bug family tripartite tricarboxylate transporter substrate binding protein [Bordetella petrii]|uniref:Bug family tripartite tricarboxylate transporter substrate binding protein n=1 Tax=Bordetella petrii TaxID=94624 RepID=UPI001E31C83F|nr:tripartite tricarboxylate transporter substrate binding protein [Bordetella petrii]MCD0501452.1 tripartite tricarboxylate transporter substrate binding protein [Bordetella petrii]
MYRYYRCGMRLLGASLLACLCLAARAADFPSQPIQFVSPYSAGGTNDFLTRLMARHMGDALPGTIVVENRAGANGIVGASYVAKAAPDGYTVLMGNSATHGTNPTLYPDAPYDPVKDFAPISMVGSVPIVLAINAGLGVNNVAELISYARKHPGKLSFGSSGVGGTGHLAGESFNAAAKLDMTHVPYKGDAPAVTDAMGGQVSMAFVGVASAAPHVASGKLKIIAVANPRRVGSLPDVPTFAEAGFKDLVFAQWYALFARAGTPDATIQKLNQAARQVIERKDVRESMASQGAEPTYTTPEELAAFSRSEVERFGRIIKDLHIAVK